MPDRLVADLRAAVGSEHVLTGSELTSAYEIDWTRRFTGRALAVVLPGTTADVVAIVRVCAAAGTPVVTQGGNSGLVGGSVPRGGEVLLSTSRLNQLEPVDRVTAQVTVGAGVTLGDLQRHVRPHGLDLSVDLGSRDLATIGGMTSTNAGGERVLRYGTMREAVLGVEMVTADGSVLSHLSGLPKDNVGFRLSDLAVGSEGTLGVVTRVRLRLIPYHRFRAAAWVGVTGTTHALTVLREVRSRLATLECAELVFEDGLDLVTSVFGLSRPFPARYPAYLLLENADVLSAESQLAGAISRVPELPDVALASDPTGRAQFWALRERHAPAVNSLGVPLKLDIAVPVAGLPAFEARLRAEVSAVAPGARLLLWAHIAEGNLHVNVVGHDEEVGAVLTERVLGLVAAAGGSISAEHGVGRAKVPWVHLSRSAAEIAAMRAIKHALDPRGLFNPGVLFPAE